MNKITKLLLLSLTILGAQYVFAAGPSSPVTGSIPVSLTIYPGCTVTPETSGAQITADAQNWASLNFGSQAGGGQALTTQGSFDIECSKGANPSLGFSTGNNPDTSAKTRQMSDGTDKLSYSLFESDGKTAVPTTSSPEKNVPNGVYTIIGKTTPPAGIAAGSYTDTVTATLTW